jgi:16S rRNA (cytosine967-C5)-methyltransferase
VECLSNRGIRSRRAALKILEQVRDGKPFDLALDCGVARLPDADRRLAHELAAGVLRQRTALDQQLAPLVPRGWGSVPAELQDILRLAAYQLRALERVPAHAAVNTSVTLAKEAGGTRAAGFVNAVLRRLAGSASPAATDSVQDATSLAARYSHPGWLVERWLDAFGPEETEALLRWNNTRPRLILQPARQGMDALGARWREGGIEVEAAPHGAGWITDRIRPSELPGYEEGDFLVQDPAQALLAQFADLPAGTLVYDACAAPGGKTIGFARRAGTIVAGDVSAARARRLAENLERAGTGREHVVVADARRPPIRSAEVVLLDAPCLGTGTFARHPDARWRITPESLASLRLLQAELLDSVAATITPGGLLIYSTCSLEREENQAQVERFLTEHANFRRESVATVAPELLSPEGDLVILPQRHGMDGAYAARLRRIA